MAHTPIAHKPHYNYADAFWCTYVVSVVSASIAEVLTYPLDLTKTRLQIQGEKGANSKNNGLPYRGMIKTALGIMKEEGVRKLWQGVTPAIYRHVIYSGIRIVTYENMRDKVFKRDKDKPFPIWKSAIGGVTSGAIAQFIASPADLVKVQIQMEGKRRLMGKPPRVKGTAHAFQKILSEGGVRGLWKGSIPNVQRAALVNLGDLTTYDTAKRHILQSTGLPDSHAIHIMARELQVLRDMIIDLNPLLEHAMQVTCVISAAMALLQLIMMNRRKGRSNYPLQYFFLNSSGCAGLVAATMGTPADVVKTRIMNQPTDVNGNGILYKSSFDCIMKTIENEGICALYKGFLPVWIRMAPWSLTFWLSFEQIRHSLGATGF